MDTLYKVYKPLLDWTYEKNSGKAVKPGQKNFMCKDEFRKLCESAGMYNKLCGDAYCEFAFVLS